MSKKQAFENVLKLRDARVKELELRREFARYMARMKTTEADIKTRQRVVVAEGYINGTITGSNADQRKAAEALAIQDDQVLQQLETNLIEMQRIAPSMEAELQYVEIERKLLEEIHELNMAFAVPGDDADNLPQIPQVRTDYPFDKPESETVDVAGTHNETIYEEQNQTWNDPPAAQPKLVDEDDLPF